MSDTATLPPPAPVPNAVLPSNFDTLAAQQTSLARSPLERHLDNAEMGTLPPGDDLGPTPPGVSDFEARLAASRARDGAQQVTSRRLVEPQAQQPVPPQQQQPANDPQKGNIEFRRPNARTAKRAQDWQAVTATRDEALARVTSLEQELASVRGGANGQPQQQASQPQQLDYSKVPVDQLLSQHPDLKRLKEERDTFYEEVKHVRVEADPEFRAKFDSRRDAAIRVAKSVSGAAAEDVAKILAIPNGDARRAQLAERLASGTFTDSSKAKITAAVASLDALDVEREMEIASRKATWDHTQASRQQAHQQQLSQRMSKLDSEFDGVVSKWADPERGMPFVLNNKDAIVASAKRIFSGESDGAALAEAAMKAAVLPDVLNLATRALQEVEKLQAQVASYTGAWPADDVTGTPSTPALPDPRNGADLMNPNYVTGFEARLAQARALDARGGGR